MKADGGGMGVGRRHWWDAVGKGMMRGRCYRAVAVGMKRMH